MFHRLLALQLCIPAAVYFSISFEWSLEELKYFFPNYLFMAAPQLLVSVLAFFPRTRKPELIWALTLLNALLVAFRTWQYFVVPEREQSFAWIAYPPLWGGALLLLAVGFGIHKRTYERNQ